MSEQKDDGTPAERAVDAVTPEQVERAAERGNRVAQKVLRQQQREENRRGGKWSR